MKPTAYLAAAVAASLLVACGGEQEELRAWTQEQRQQVKPTITPVTAPTQFVPEAFAGVALPDPFGAQKLASDNGRSPGAANALLASEAGRRRQPLEEYPLDALALVGSVVRAGRATALVTADGKVYEVSVGDYLGQNSGKVMRISATDLALREIVPDAAGEWASRTTTMQLQEKAQ